MYKQLLLTKVLWGHHFIEILSLPLSFSPLAVSKVPPSYFTVIFQPAPTIKRLFKSPLL